MQAILYQLSYKGSLFPLSMYFIHGSAYASYIHHIYYICVSIYTKTVYQILLTKIHNTKAFGIKVSKEYLYR